MDVNLQSYGPKLQTFHGEYGTYVNSSDVMPVQTKWFHDTGGDQVSQQFVFGCVVLLNASDFNLFQTYIFHMYRKLKFFIFPDGAAAVQGDGYQQPGRGWDGQQTGGGLQRHLQQRPQQRRGQQQLLHLLGGRHLGLLQ